MGDEKNKQSTEDLQREILEVELQTKKLLLGEAKKRNEEFQDKERRRRKENKKRMAELAEAKRNHEALVSACRHKSGGNPRNILKGGGIGSFSIITRAILPDGVTILLQCPRCRMLKYPPPPSMKTKQTGQSADEFSAQLAQYSAELKEYNRLLEESRDNGLEHAEMRGPTFFFQNAEGVPFIPDRK